MPRLALREIFYLFLSFRYVSKGPKALSIILSGQLEAPFVLQVAMDAINFVFILHPPSSSSSCSSPQALTASREFFMSEQVILQYIGFIETHMSIIRKGKHSGKPREGKVFYQVRNEG